MISVSHIQQQDTHFALLMTDFKVKELSGSLEGASSCGLVLLFSSCSHFYQATAGWCRCSLLIICDGRQKSEGLQEHQVSIKMAFSLCAYVCVCRLYIPIYKYICIIWWDERAYPPPVNAAQSHSSIRPAGQWCAQMRNETPPTQWRTSRSAW